MSSSSTTTDPKPPLKLTVEIIDKMMELRLAVKGDDWDEKAWDELMEFLWGSEQHGGALPDLLVLARVALEHLNTVIVRKD